MDVSFKAVIFDSAGRVLLGANPRNEWELLGGRADVDDQGPRDTITRELSEEAGIEVHVDQVLDIWFYDIPGEGRVAVASYLAQVVGVAQIRSSDEHGELRFFALAELDTLPMPEQYKTTIRAASALANRTYREGLR